MDVGVFISFLLIVLYYLAETVESFILNGEEDLLVCPFNVRRLPHVYPYRDWCFEFNIDGSGEYWDEASEKCKSRGGHLVEVSDSYIQAFLMYVLSYKLFYEEDYLWIGLNDKDTEHSWMWDSGHRLHGYSNWALHEDNDNILHWSQDCVLLAYSKDGKWYDNSCEFLSEYYDYICQYDKRVIPSTHPPKTAAPTHKTTTTTTSKPTTTTLRPTTSTTRRTTTIPTTLRPTTIKTTYKTTSTTHKPTTTTTTLRPTTPTTRRTTTKPTTLPPTTMKTTRRKTTTSSTLPTTIKTTPVRTTHRPTTTEPRTTTSITTKQTTSMAPPKTALATTPKMASTSYIPITSSTKQTTVSLIPTSQTLTENHVTTPETTSQTIVTKHVTTLETTSQTPVSTETTTKVECDFVNCQEKCPHGYSGLYVGSDGCIACKCNS